VSKKARFSRGALATVLVVLAVLAFIPAVEAPFVSDDKLAVIANEYVVDGRSAFEIFSNFSWWGSLRGDAPGYRPLVTLTYAWNWAAAAGNPLSYHIVNLVLHALVVWLTFLLALRLGLDDGAAFAAAALFAILPIHSEAVIWTVGRAELMAAAAWATSLLALLDYRRKGSGASLALAGVALLAGLFCKENAITVLAAPVVLAVVMPLPERRRRRDLIAIGVLALAVVVYFAIRAASGPVLPGKAPDSLDNPLSGLDMFERIAGAAALAGRYLWLTIASGPLSVDYSYNALGISEGFSGDRYTLFGVASIVGLTIWAIRERKTNPVITVSLCMAAAAYSIVSNSILLIGTIMGERLFYLPTLGLCLAVAPALDAAAKSASGRGAWGLIALGLAALVLDWQRALVWNDPVTLFESAAAAHPNSARAHMELGSAYGAAGRPDDAIAAFSRSVAVKPNYASAWYNLGNLYARSGRHDEAIENYKTALEHAPKLTPAWFNLGMVYRITGKPAMAQGAFAQATEIAPGDGESQMAYGDTLLSLGRNREAADAYTAALDAGISPGLAGVNRGVARERIGGCEAALPDYLAVARQLPGHGTAVANAVNCLRRVGRENEVEQLLARARVANRNSGR
jgi:tetratricopeptide (TPR) repeat protein